MSAEREASRSETTRVVVERFMSAWSDGDLEGVLALMSEDAVFIGTTGPEPGRSFKGLESIGKAIAPLLSPGSTIRLQCDATFIAGDTAIATWTTFDSASKLDRATMKGVDIFRVRNGKIVLKDAYRKAY